MSNLILAVKTDVNNKITTILYGGVPWEGIKEISIEEALSSNAKFDNARISDKGDIVCQVSNIQRYTTISPNKTKRSYVVLAKSEDYNGDIFFVTDGIDNPIWLHIDALEDNFNKKGIGLANCKLDTSTAEYKVVPLGGEFEQVDYKEIQLQYRKYLKGLK